MKSIVALLCLLTVSAAAGSEPADSSGLGEKTLRAKLMIRYPTVQKWDIAPLRPTVQATSGSTGPAEELTAFVTRMGVRSAVLVAPSRPSHHSRGELIWYSVAGWGPATVATHRLTRGVALDTRDGTAASGDLVAAGCATLASPAALEGMRARVTIEEGEVICAAAVDARPPVARGDDVVVRYLEGPVTLTAHAIAQADGLLGKPILVRSTTSGDVFRATVSGKAEVRVDD